MAKKDTTKTKAELYREERKERIAKANKKNAKSIEKGKAVAGVVKKIVAVVLAIAIVGGIAFWINSTTGIVENLAPAVKVGGKKVSATEYDYYYHIMYQQTSYTAQQYSQYGMNMGFNADVAPDDPSNTTTDEDGNSITWAEAFRTSAIDRAQFIEAYYNEAVKAGFELSQDSKDQIEETVENYKSNAESSGYTVSAYLKANFGPGFTEKRFRKQIEKEQLATEFYTSKQEEISDGISLDDIKKTYEESKKDYDYSDIHYYTFTAETLTAKDGESDDALEKRQKAENEKTYDAAQAVYNKVTDVASLETALKEYLDTKEAEEKAAEAKDAVDQVNEEIASATASDEEEEESENSTALKHTTYSSVKSSVGEKAAEWVYDSARKAGDKTLIKDGANAYIIIVDRAAYTGSSVDVRHCLVKFNAADEDNVTDEEKAAARKTAEDLLAEWEKGDKTDESFATLAKEHSEDDGSKDDGGLLAGTRITDSLVEEFLNWTFADGRKEGDYGIVESVYGYHIMYLSKNNKDDLDQYNVIRTDKGKTAFEEYDKALLAEDGDYPVESSDYWTKKIMNDFCKKIKKNLAYQSK